MGAIVNFSTARAKAPLIYKMNLVGIKNNNLSKDFNERSLLKKLKEKSVYSVNLIKRRGQIDQKLLQKLLLSYGYYDGTVKYDFNKSAQNLTLTFTVDQEKRYHIRNLCVQFEPSYPLIKRPCLLDLTKVAMKENLAVRSEDLLSIFQEINDHLSNCGYPNAQIIKHEAILDTTDRKVDIMIYIDPGKYYTFSTVHLTKPDNIPEAFIRNRIPFKMGETYNQEKIDALRMTLLKSQLFKKIDIKTQKKQAVGDQLPIDVTVKEAPLHTLTGGVKYSTTQGAGITGSWIHRNYTGRADKLQATADLGQLEKGVEVTHILPDVFIPLQSLNTAAQIKDQETDSFKLIGCNAAAILKRPLDDHWSLSYGINGAADVVTRYKQRQNVRSIGLPVSADYDTRDDILNPIKGGLYKLALTPEGGKIGDARFIVSSTLFASHHLTFDSKKFYTLSGWARYSTISGTDTSKVAFNRRYYMGGSRSVRGYGYQLAGPVDNNGKPLGGLSTTEFSLEPRIKFTDVWGGAVFYDVGIINNKNSSFKVNDNRFESYGFGARYYTSFGPIRADVALPKKRRNKVSTGKKLDAPFQLYISIGQAF